MAHANSGQGTPLGGVEPEDREGEGTDTYLLLPILGSEGEYLAVFADGSYTRWMPDDAAITPVAWET
jgi:hypothetical protein